MTDLWFGGNKRKPSALLVETSPLHIAKGSEVLKEDLPIISGSHPDLQVYLLTFRLERLWVPLGSTEVISTLCLGKNTVWPHTPTPIPLHLSNTGPGRAHLLLALLWLML